MPQITSFRLASPSLPNLVNPCLRQRGAAQPAAQLQGGHCASCARGPRRRFRLSARAAPGIRRRRPLGTRLLCQARALTDLRVETREVRSGARVELKSLPCRIERLDRVADDVMAVFLRLPAVEEFNYRRVSTWT